MATVLERFGTLDHENDAVLVIGTDYRAAGAANEPSLNAQLATNLSAAAIVVVDGRSGEDADEVATAAALARSVLIEHGAPVLGVVANRVPPERMNDVRVSLERIRREPEELIAVMPGSRLIEAPRASRTGPGGLRRPSDLRGPEPARRPGPRLHRRGDDPSPGPGGVEDRRARVRSRRPVGHARGHPDGPPFADLPPSGGGAAHRRDQPEPIVRRLIDGIETGLPVAATPRTTFEAATVAAATRGSLTDSSPHRSRRHWTCSPAMSTRGAAGPSGSGAQRSGHADHVRTRTGGTGQDAPQAHRAPRGQRATGPASGRAGGQTQHRRRPSARQPRADPRGRDPSGADISGCEILDPYDDKLRHRLATEYARPGPTRASPSTPPSTS